MKLNKKLANFKIMENKKVVFADLDGTLIETLSGETHPKGVWDVKLKMDVWGKIIQAFPKMEYLLIVTNQGGIETGKVDKEHWTSKIMWIIDGLQEYVKAPVFVSGACCTSIDKSHPARKPNVGLFERLSKVHQLEGFSKQEMIMLGDASGREGDWSDSDKKAAENFGIDYLDVGDLIKM